MQQLHAAVLLGERRDPDGVARLQLVLEEVTAHLDDVLHLRKVTHTVTELHCSKRCTEFQKPRHNSERFKRDNKVRFINSILLFCTLGADDRYSPLRLSERVTSCNRFRKQI